MKPKALVQVQLGVDALVVLLAFTGGAEDAGILVNLPTLVIAMVPELVLSRNKGERALCAGGGKVSDDESRSIGSKAECKKGEVSCQVS